MLTCIVGISSIRLHIPKDVRPPSHRQVALPIAPVHRRMIAHALWPPHTWTSRHLPRYSLSVQAVALALAETEQVFGRTGIPMLDSVEDMQIDDEAFKKMLRARAACTFLLLACDPPPSR